ncbi:hypothetical protein FA13DRAFT_1723655 [Coprinellus micaceus]|uniref:Uncharacterized protein n=1 Tax=Coprinellus micaceus TaxID=71717 RepID=A0A4Y7TZP2_COPMI|nr:hypothetical protein FA13DRAFT_1723655 [Coprinellus micaceus]
MPIPVLPQEILDLLVDTHKLYSPEDRTSLWRLAQASRCFLDRCYSSIFKEVCFGVPSETGKEGRIFEEFPHLCKYIRVFRAECNMQGFTIFTSGRDDELQRSMLHIARLSTGIERIQLIPTGKSINFLFQQRPSSVSIGMILDFPLQKLSKLSSLKHLVVDWGFSFSEERNRHGLRTLQPFSQCVEDSQVQLQTPLHSHSLQIYPNLVNLSLSISSIREHVFRWDNVISAKNLPVTLRSLQLQYHCHARQRDADDYNLDRWGQVLKDVESNGRSLPSFPNLQSFAIQLDVRSGYAGTNEIAISDLLPQFLVALIDRQPQPSLTKFSAIVLWWADYSGPLNTPISQTHFLGQGWQHLNTILESPPLLPTLTSVHFRVGFGLPGVPEHTGLAEEARPLLEAQLLETFSSTAKRVWSLEVESFSC